jgi:hypothetical protein
MGAGGIFFWPGNEWITLSILPEMKILEIKFAEISPHQGVTAGGP